MKKKLSVISGFFLSIGFIYIISKNVNIDILKNSFYQIKLVWVIPVIFITFIEVFFRGIKWKIILSPVKNINIFELFKLEIIGLSINNILPLRIGELIRGFMAGKNYSLSYVFVFSTILIERIADMVALLLIVAIVSYYGNFIPDIFGYKKYLFVLAFFAFFSISFIISIDKIKEISFFKIYIEKHPKIKHLIEKINEGGKCFHSIKNLTLIFSIALLQWFLNSLSYFFIACSFSINEKVNFFKSAALVFASAFAASLPSMPGYFGNIEFAVSKIMNIWGINYESSLAYAFSVHFIGYICITILGIFFIYRAGYSLKGIFNYHKNIKQEG